MHASGERHLLGFMHGEQVLVEGLDHRIASGGNQGGHVQRSSHSRPAAPDHALSALLATVLIEGRQSDEGGDLLVRDRAKLGEVG